MIIGIGTDIAAITRFQDNIDKHGERFAGKILSPLEISAYDSSKLQAQFLASRFAAKEALAKAFGTGFRDGLIMPDIAVLSDDSGKPYFKLAGHALALSEKLGVQRFHLSISHENLFAIAFVILE